MGIAMKQPSPKFQASHQRLLRETVEHLGEDMY
jgi:hypothetical protein